MTKEELEKEVEDKGIKYADSLEFEIPKFSDEEGYCWSQVEQAYEKGALDFAEPREKRIADLKETNKKISNECHKLVNSFEKLQNENAELKESADFWEERYWILNDVYVKVATEKDKQLTKAKEIIKKFSEFVNNKIEYAPERPQEHTDLWNKLCAEAEQFLKETAE